jgi:hypothetical protein
MAACGNTTVDPRYTGVASERKPSGTVASECISLVFQSFLVVFVLSPMAEIVNVKQGRTSYADIFLFLDTAKVAK